MLNFEQGYLNKAGIEPLKRLFYA